MQDRRQQQREKRKEKRQLEHQLKAQAQKITNDIPVSIFDKIDKSFLDFAISETKCELRNGSIEPDREILLRRVIDLKNVLLAHK
ncbi:hypothetical protein SBF1_2970003 [Candidatus Desulfosporosinus infrequens]|uniref:Uncharacterized protein n=1 Tax=Candidatus Desulfosporosinus infrequens TaxID=2043169 RepID=A0A2U3KW49_9FIRM|nr:hypothetical protein SBF1_2970003 [Candidatus Desulfosporosinus infrequens]